MELICKGCGKKIKINEMKGAELLAVTSVLGHIMTCKELKEKAGEQGEGLKEFMKVFFEFNEEKKGGMINE